MAWSLLKEAALRDLVAKGVPYHVALELNEVENAQVLDKKKEILQRHRERENHNR